MGVTKGLLIKLQVRAKPSLGKKVNLITGYFHEYLPCKVTQGCAQTDQRKVEHIRNDFNL